MHEGIVTFHPGLQTCQYDFKGRLPSMLAPKNSMTYGDLIGEAYLKSHSHYYWAARVATSDRIRIETVMTSKIKELEESNRAIEAESQKALETSQLQNAEQIEAMSVENVQLKEQLVYYQTTYDGAEEREQALVVVYPSSCFFSSSAVARVTTDLRIASSSPTWSLRDFLRMK